GGGLSLPAFNSSDPDSTSSAIRLANDPTAMILREPWPARWRGARQLVQETRTGPCRGHLHELRSGDAAEKSGEPWRAYQAREVRSVSLRASRSRPVCALAKWIAILSVLLLHSGCTICDELCGGSIDPRWSLSLEPIP